MRFRRMPACLLLLAPLPALAWGPTGHRVVAEVAQRHLDPQAAARVGRILGARTLADVANWPDELREDPGYDKYKPLHYATVPDGETYAQSAKDPCGDVVAAIRALAAFLRTGDRAHLRAVPALDDQAEDPAGKCNLKPTPSIDEERALALLVHMVGDIHQPLHVGGTDRGGNVVQVDWMGAARVNLHAVWDEELIEHEQFSYSEYAQYLDRIFAEPPADWFASDAAEWAEESASLRPALYRFPDEPRPPPASKAAGGASLAELRPQLSTAGPVLVSWGYIGAQRATLRRQLAKGGLRLARLLNATFAATAP